MQRVRLVKLVVTPVVIIEEDGVIVDDGEGQAMPVYPGQLPGWSFDVPEYERQATQALAGSGADGPEPPPPDA